MGLITVLLKGLTASNQAMSSGVYASCTNKGGPASLLQALGAGMLLGGSTVMLRYVHPKIQLCSFPCSVLKSL